MRLHALQYLRAVAALAVVFSHSTIQVENYREWLPEFGSFGVDIFFVISGFIMVWIAKPGDTPRAFITNRIRRVVPLYWFFTLLMAAILLLLPALFKNTVFDPMAVVQSLAFWPHYSTAQSDQVWPIVAPGWSLNYEMYFYLLFALSLLVISRLRLLFVAIGITSVFLIAVALDTGGAVSHFYSESIVFEFLLGMGLAHAWKRGLRLSPGIGWMLIVSGFALISAQLPVPRIFEFGVPATLIVAGSLFVSLPDIRWMTLLGDASYALYLSHIFTLGLLRKVLPPVLGEGVVAAWGFVALALVICTLVSIIVHLLIDNWLLRNERLQSFGRVRPV